MLKFLPLVNAFFFAALAVAQQPAAKPTTPSAQPQWKITNPHYVSIPMTTDVNAPADKVWARIGHYCDIGEWFNSPQGNTCKLIEGDGDFGTVRTVGTEVLVGKTEYSYTYTQAPRENTPYNLYHGTLSVEPLTPTTSRINYVLLFDNSMLADDAARQSDINNRRDRFTVFLQNMKTLSEGGKLPAPAQPSGAARPATTPAPLLSLHPHYVSLPMQIDINAPIDKVWSRIGKYCDIGEWGIGSCKMLSGNEGDYGSIRSVGDEVLVGKTRYSYTYTQPLRTSGFYELYHGTIEARPKSATSTTIYYTLVFDNSNFPDDAARKNDYEWRRNLFTHWLQNMKTLAEGGKLAPEALGVPPR